MKDGLKDYVDKNRDDFEVPADGLTDLWGGIADKLATAEASKEPKAKHIRWQPVMRVAAAILVGVCLVVIGLQYTKQTNPAQQEIALSEVGNELAETSEYYATQIEYKIEIIKTSSREVDPAIWDDIALLDQAFNELKEDLKDNADNEEVVNAMIQNYRIKLEILEHIIDELQHDEEGI